MEVMYSELLLDKAEEAAQGSSEAPGDGRDADTHGTVCQSVFVAGLMCVRMKETLGVKQRSDSVSVRAICPRLSAFIG